MIVCLFWFMRWFRSVLNFCYSSHIPSRHEREVNEFRKLEREKSFDEARTAVQSQIEKIFLKTTAAAANHAKSKNNLTMANAANARLSRRDQEADKKTTIHATRRPRVPSIEPKLVSSTLISRQKCLLCQSFYEDLNQDIFRSVSSCLRVLIVHISINDIVCKMYRH